jgi:DNA-binding protein H-NS
MKTDVFKRIIWYAYKGENGMVALTPERVAEIKKLNKDGVKPKDLADFAQVKEKVEEIGYQNVVGQDSLTRFEKSFSNNNNKKRRPNRKPRKPNPGGPKNEKAN